MNLTDKTKGDALLLEDVEFSYPGSTAPTIVIPAFQLKSGESLFLHGPSGSGKSTLLEIIGGIHLPQKGRVVFAGQDLVTLSGPERDRLRADHMGFIFQSFNLLPFLTARQNIQLGLHFSRRKQQNSAHGELEEIAARLGLTKILDQTAGTLSVGQSQRVAAARAVLGKPELLIADEPTSSLDADHRERFMEVLFELAASAGQTLLFVSHDRSLAKRFTREISLLDINQVMGHA